MHEHSKAELEEDDEGDHDVEEEDEDGPHTRAKRRAKNGASWPPSHITEANSRSYTDSDDKDANVPRTSRPRKAMHINPEVHPARYSITDCLNNPFQFRALSPMPLASKLPRPRARALVLQLSQSHNARCRQTASSPIWLSSSFDAFSSLPATPPQSRRKIVADEGDRPNFSFTIAQQGTKPGYHDCLPTSSAVLPVGCRLIRIYLATKNPYPDENTKTAEMKACFIKATRDANAWTLVDRFNKEPAYLNWVLAVVCTLSPRSLLTTHSETNEATYVSATWRSQKVSTSPCVWAVRAQCRELN